MAEDIQRFVNYYRAFNKNDWYWIATDGRIYGSARSDLVPVGGDAAYQAWLDMGNTPTPWPKDDTGNETKESLEGVLQS